MHHGKFYDILLSNVASGEGGRDTVYETNHNTQSKIQDNKNNSIIFVHEIEFISEFNENL